MKIVFATNNHHKIQEIQALLPTHIEILSLESIGCFEEIPETATTIEENAVMKANYVLEHYGFDCFADDTGLEVESLHGEPGVFSARYAGEARNADDNMDKLLQNLEGKSNRSAQFKTVICLNINGKQQLFAGIAKGVIRTQKAGDSGFGYDPIFCPDGYAFTFAQLSFNEKNRISHRAKAASLLLDYLNEL